MCGDCGSCVCEDGNVIVFPMTLFGLGRYDRSFVAMADDLVNLMDI